MIVTGNISITRPAGGGMGEFINVELIDEQSRARFVTLRIRMDDFTRALTGFSAMPCEMDVRGLDVVGKRREWKEVRVEFPKSLMPDGIEYGEHKEWFANYLNASHVEPGWINDTYLGSQKSIGGSGDNIVLNFSRYRFVDADPITPTMFPSGAK